MNKIRIISAIGLLFTVLLVGSQPALASGEQAEATVSIEPRSGPSLFSNAFSAVNWSVDTSIIPAGPFPEVLTITPMKVADLQFPGNGVLTFNPKASMPVCPDDQLGPPPTANSIPVPNMIARCPDSLLGNGTAVFGLAQSTSPVATRDGEILVFNGGRVGGLPKIKVYAYSYDTFVGIYTSAVLQPDGQLRFDIPQLTADSSVRSMNLSIPGSPIVREKPNFGLTVTLPAGQDKSYVQAKCVDNAGFPWSAEFTLGSRDNGGNPIGPETVVNDSGTVPCAGIRAQARLASIKVSGPGRAKLNKPVRYRVEVSNSGTIAATGVRLRASGRGVAVNVPVGQLGPGATRTVTLRLRPRKAGKIRATFKVSSANAGSRSLSKVIRVGR